MAWFPPAPMNNTYGFAATQKTAQRLGVEKLSDLKEIPPEKRTFCVESELGNHNDGLEPMLKAYDIPLGSEVPRDNLRALDTGAIYAATAKGTWRDASLPTWPSSGSGPRGSSSSGPGVTLPPRIGA